MPVTVINQPTTATGRTNWLVWIVIKLFHSSIYPTPSPGPSNALEAKPWGFENAYGVEIGRLSVDYLPADWQNRHSWSPLYIKRNASKSKRLIIYYHGGGFVNMISMPQWGLIGRLAKELEADVMLQTYVMVPHGGIHDNIDRLMYIYQEIREIALQNGQELILAGDSAGGTITAAMLLALNDKNIPLPDQAIMLAPAFVMDFETPENRALEPVDPILSINKFAASTRAWATGKVDRERLFKPAPPPTAEETKKMQHPYAAPLYGNWEFAAKAKLPMTLSQGTYDILLPQVDQFVEKAKELDLELTYIRAETACHVYPMLSDLPFPGFLAPDSVEGLKLIVASVKRYSQK